jgi:hypothetical protein
VSYTASQILKDAKMSCCDYLTGKVAEGSTPNLNFGNIIEVPDSWLIEDPEGTATQYHYMVYIKEFAPYGWVNKANLNYIAPLYNEYDGQIAQFIYKVWDIKYVNFNPEIVTAMGFKGKIIDDITTP